MNLPRVKLLAATQAIQLKNHRNTSNSSTDLFNQRRSRSGRTSRSQHIVNQQDAATLR